MRLRGAVGSALEPVPPLVAAADADGEGVAGRADPTVCSDAVFECGPGSAHTNDDEHVDADHGADACDATPVDHGEQSSAGSSKTICSIYENENAHDSTQVNIRCVPLPRSLPCDFLQASALPLIRYVISSIDFLGVRHPSAARVRPKRHV